MKNTINLKNHYTVSDEVISKEIEGEIVIVPLESGIGKLDESIFSLNKTGKIIWDMLDGSMSIEKIIDNLSSEFSESKKTIGSDVIELVTTLVNKGFIVEIK